MFRPSDVKVKYLKHKKLEFMIKIIIYSKVIILCDVFRIFSIKISIDMQILVNIYQERNNFISHLKLTRTFYLAVGRIAWSNTAHKCQHNMILIHLFLNFSRKKTIILFSILRFILSYKFPSKLVLSCFFPFASKIVRHKSILMSPLDKII